MYTLSIKRFQDLDINTMYEILLLRQEVFVVEQNCVYQDLDGLDQKAIHFMYYEEGSGKLAAYARLIEKGIVYKQFISIGRVVVHPQMRRVGLGKKIMNDVVSYCLNSLGTSDIKISAQTYLKAFYESLGFHETGSHYLEDGIPHMAMEYRL